MRAELEILEKIDAYLGHTMTSAEKIAFENQIASDPALKSLVENQKLLIQTVNRQAIMAEISAVAGTAAVSTATWLAALKWGLSALGIGGLVWASVFIFNDTDEDVGPERSKIVQSTEVNEVTIENENNLPIVEDTFETDTTDADKDLYISNTEIQEPVKIKRELDDEGNKILDTGNHVKIQEGETDQKVMNETLSHVDTTQKKKSNDKDPEMNRTSQFAHFPIGKYDSHQASLAAYASEELVYPGTPMSKHIEGKVEVDFIVMPTGKIAYIETECLAMWYAEEREAPIKGVQALTNGKSRKLFEKRARNFVSTMPIWEPATDSFGNRIESACRLIIEFRLDCSLVYMVDINSKERSTSEEMSRD